MRIRSSDDRVLYANPAALAHLGIGSLAELRHTPPRQIMAGYDV